MPWRAPGRVNLGDRIQLDSRTLDETKKIPHLSEFDWQIDNQVLQFWSDYGHF